MTTIINNSISYLNKSKNEIKIYNYLREINKRITTTKLAENVGISPKNIERYLNPLEKKNLIIKEISETDKRVKYISLKKEKEILKFCEFNGKYLLIKDNTSLKKSPLINEKLFKELDLEFEKKTYTIEAEREEDEILNPTERFPFYTSEKLNEVRKKSNYETQILTEEEKNTMRSFTHFTMYYFPEEENEEAYYSFILRKKIDKGLAYFDYAYLRINDLLEKEVKKVDIPRLAKIITNTSYHLKPEGWKYLKELYRDNIKIKEHKTIKRTKESEIYFDEMLIEVMEQNLNATMKAQENQLVFINFEPEINRLKYLKLLLKWRISAQKINWKNQQKKLTEIIEQLRDNPPSELLKLEFNEKNLNQFL